MLSEQSKRLSADLWQEQPQGIGSNLIVYSVVIWCMTLGVAHIHHSIEAQRRYAFASLGKVGELEACLHAEKEQKRADLAEEKAAAEASLVSGSSQ